MTVRKELAAGVLTDLLFDEPGVGRCLVAPDGSVLRANPEWLRSTGFALDDVLGADIVDLFPDTRDMALAMHARVRAGHRVEVPRHAQRTRGGETWWQGSIAPVPMDGGTGLLITAREVGTCGAGSDVTARRGVEDALRESEARFRAIFETTTDAIIVVDHEGGGSVLSVNPAACRMFGYSEEEFRGLDRARMLDVADGALRKFLADRERSGDAKAEFTYRRKDGTRFTGEVSSAIFGAPGQRRAVAIIRDVTERKRADAAFDAERMRWRGVVEGIADEVWVCDATGKMTLINLPETTAMGLEEFEGKTVQEVLEAVEILYPTGDPRPPEEAPLLRSLRTGAIVRGEEVMRHRATGRVRHRQFSCAPVRDEAGTITGAVAIARDITAQKRAEEAARARAAEVEAILGCIPEALIVYDEEGVIVRANACARAMLGYTDRELEMPVVDRVDATRATHGWMADDGRPLAADDLPAVRALTTGETINGFILRQQTRELERWLSASAAPFLVGGQRHGAVLFMADVTGLKRTERALREANSKLQHSDRLKDEFLSAASHELRTPLTTLILHTQGLLRAMSSGPLDEGVLPRKLASMKGQLDRLNRLVGTLLDVSRISAGRLHLEREPCDLAQLAAEAVDGFETIAQRHGSTCMLAASTVTGHWDRLRLEQVLTNLLDNAIKYAPASTVEVGVGARDGDAVLTVRDSGPGIPRESQERIFQQYERAAEAHVFGGLGLGLWISRQIAEAHGGSISVESEPGAGSTFTVRLPLEQR